MLTHRSTGAAIPFERWVAAATPLGGGRRHPPLKGDTHPLSGGGGPCARWAETNFPAGINQGQEAAPPLPPLFCFCVPWFN